MSNVNNNKKTYLNSKTSRNDKCFICGSSNHFAKLCPNKIAKIPQCEKCHNIGHCSKDCLLMPDRITEDIIKKNKICCFVCKSDKHLICKKENEYVIEGYNTDEVEVSSDDDEDNNNSIQKEEKIYKRRLHVFIDLPNEKIKSTVFCYKCGGRHSYKDCIEDKITNKKNPRVIAIHKLIKKIKEKKK